MEEEEEEEQAVVVDRDLFRRVLYAFYQVHNPARIADTPEAQGNFDALVDIYHVNVKALNERLRPQYGAELQPAELGLDRHWKPDSASTTGGPFSAGFGANPARYRHPLEPPS
jgi:hypothetical protein